ADRVDRVVRGGPMSLSLPAPLGEVSPNLIHFMISYVIALIAFTLIAVFYVWPAIRRRAPRDALTPLLLYACLRVNGLMFLMPGLASPRLSQAFAIPTAYGDMTAAILALVAIALLRTRSVFAFPLIWIFNVEGFVDLAYAHFSTFKDHVDPVDLGVDYY